MEANILWIVQTISFERPFGRLSSKDCEMVPGAGGKDKQGPYFGKLTRFVQRLETKKNDKRLNFMFNSKGDLLDYNFMNHLCSSLMRLQLLAIWG